MISRFRWVLPLLIVGVWLGFGGVLGTLGGKLGDVVVSGAASYLPEHAEAARVLDLNSRFGDEPALPATVVYSRDGLLTEADTAGIAADMAAVRRELGDRLVRDPVGPIMSDDGQAAQVVVLFAGTDEIRITPHVQQLRKLLNDADGRTVQVAGPAGVQADIQDALGAVDLMLLMVTAGVILLILVLVYRSPLLPLLVLAVSGTALGAAQGVIYLLARNGAMSLGSEVQGILSVLVLGAATDHALLLIARFREELRVHADRYVAMRAALRGAVGPIVASGGTVALGLACLVVSDLGLNRQLGPAGAIGIACALIAMLTLLPAALVLLGRAAFWPRRPDHGSEGTERTGAWARTASMVDRRPRLIWVGTALALAVMSLAVFGLRADGLSATDQIIAGSVESKSGQRTLGAHFAAGSGNPVLVITNADQATTVAEVARTVSHVDSATPYTGSGATAVVADGRARVDVVLDVGPDTEEAADTVAALRQRLGAVPDADALVGGYTAVKLDFDATAAQDRIVIPLLLAVVLLIVAVLLRSLVAPVLLLATVVLSFFAAIGLSTLIFQNLLGFPGVDSTFPLHAFVFLVALGIDYNIFLMTRVREEAHHHGTRRGTRIGLAMTGGVITSAGVVLAATFAALAVIPLVLMVELAITVALGVLLDALLVRTLLVPALSMDVGRFLWWPSRLASVRDTNDEIPAVPARPSRTGETPDVPQLIGER